MKNILAFAMPLLLCCCGFMTPVKQYVGEQKSLADLAVIKAYIGVPFTDEIHSTISGYSTHTSTGESKRKSFGIKGFTDYPHNIHVVPGEYDIELYCFKIPTPNVHKIVRLSARPGYTYLLKCTFENGETKAVLAAEEKSPTTGN